jgi:hypothetical protein
MKCSLFNFENCHPNLRRLIFLVAFAASGLAPSASAAQSTPGLESQLTSHYKAAGAHFWRGENLLSAQTSSRAERNALLVAPLPASHAAYREYSQCA